MNRNSSNAQHSHAWPDILSCRGIERDRDRLLVVERVPTSWGLSPWRRKRGESRGVTYLYQVKFQRSFSIITLTFYICLSHPSIKEGTVTSLCLPAMASRSMDSRLYLGSHIVIGSLLFQDCALQSLAATRSILLGGAWPAVWNFFEHSLTTIFHQSYSIPVQPVHCFFTL